MSSRIKPDISQLIDQLEDETLREIFRRIIAFNEDEPQLQGFQHLIITTDSAQAHIKIRHNLKFIPKDIIKTKKTGSGTITFNYALFDEDFIDATTTGAVNFRGFFGTFLKDDSNEISSSTETF